MIEAETCCHLVSLNKINIHNASCVLTCESLLLTCVTAEIRGVFPIQSMLGFPRALGSRYITWSVTALFTGCSAVNFTPRDFFAANILYLSRVWLFIYSDWLRAGRSGDRIPVGARFSAPVQTGPGTHPAFCIMGTGSFLGVKSGRGVTLTPHPLLVPWSRKGRAIPVLSLWAVRPVQSLSACTRGALYCLLFNIQLSSSSSCSGRIRFDSCSLYPQNEICPSISSSVVLCVFVLLVYIVVLV